MSELGRRLRLGAATHPRTFWAAVAAVTVVVVVSVTGALRRAEATRAAWGTTRAVLVATRDLEPGDPLDPSTATRRHLPVALLPPDALTDHRDGAVVARPVAAGEAVLARRLAGPGVPPPGTRAVAVPVPAPSPPLHPGAVVDLAGPAGVVTRGAVVLSTGPEGAVVAVAIDDLAAVAAAVTSGAVVVAVAPG